MKSFFVVDKTLPIIVVIIDPPAATKVAAALPFHLAVKKPDI